MVVQLGQPLSFGSSTKVTITCLCPQGNMPIEVNGKPSIIWLQQALYSDNCSLSWRMEKISGGNPPNRAHGE